MAKQRPRHVANEVRSTIMRGSETASRISPHKQLWGEVEKLIAPARTSNERPPFSHGELIVFALLQGPERGLDDAGVLEGIFSMFPFFTKKAIAEAARACSYAIYYGRDHRPRIGELDAERFRMAFDEYSLPVTSRCKSETFEKFGLVYKIEPHEARLYLSKYFEPERDGIFPFLDLPPELRVSVYEYLSTLSGPEGLQRYDDGGGSASNDFFSRRRANGSTKMGLKNNRLSKQEADSFNTSPYSRFRVPVRRSISELPFTCKQIYREAMPHFTFLNGLHFPSYAGDCFINTIGKMPEVMFHNVKHISMNPSWALGARSRKAEITYAMFQKLAQAKSIGTFEVRGGDWAWMLPAPKNNRERSREFQLNRFAAHEGVAQLATMASKAAKFVLVGFPLLAEYIQEESKRLKAEAASANAAQETDTLAGDLTPSVPGATESGDAVDSSNATTNQILLARSKAKYGGRNRKGKGKGKGKGKR